MKYNKIMLMLMLIFIISIKSNGILDTQIQEQQNCDCLNYGTCINQKQLRSCVCIQGFIGNKCQISALQIKQQPISTQITQFYKYFYFQPKYSNYFQMNLKICILKNSIFYQKFTNLIFLSVQNISGKLKLQPSIYQTSPMTFQPQNMQNIQNNLQSNKQKNNININNDNNNDTQICHTFYTHYIPIHKKLNDQYQKIIFGISIKNNSDSIANQWVNFLQNKLKQYSSFQSLSQQKKLKQNNQHNQLQQLNSLKMTISCTYQLFLVENYWGQMIIILSGITLIISVIAFIYTIRTKIKYFNQLSLINYETIRIYNITQQLYRRNQIQKNMKNGLNHFDIIMPPIQYGKLQKMEKEKNYKLKRLNIQISKRLIQQQQQQSKIQEHISDNQHNPEQTKSSNTQNINIQILQSQEIIKNCSQSDLQKTCIICLLAFSQHQLIRQTPCFHIFHSECIDNWCENTLNCPICRRSLEDIKNRKNNYKNIGFI